MMGGAFEIDINLLKNIEKCNSSKESRINYYGSGSSALYNIMCYMKNTLHINKIYMPDYLCHTIVNAAKKACLKILYYPIKHNLSIDIDAFQSIYKNNDKSAVLVINYFGMSDIRTQVKLLKSLDNDIVILLDDVQALFDFFYDDINVDFKCTSVRKTLPIPDGGLVKCRREYKLEDSVGKNIFSQYMYSAGILKSLRGTNCFGDNIYLDLFSKGEDLLDENLDSAISNTSLTLLNMIDLEDISKKRIVNSNYLINGLKQLGIEPILSPSGNQVPLFIPIYLNNRDKVRKYMMEHEVFCPVHWPVEDASLNRGIDMEAHELSLLIDQRYNIQNMEFILSLLDDSMNY